MNCFELENQKSQFEVENLKSFLLTEKLYHLNEIGLDIGCKNNSNFVAYSSQMCCRVTFFFLRRNDFKTCF